MYKAHLLRVNLGDLANNEFRVLSADNAHTCDPYARIGFHDDGMRVREPRRIDHALMHVYRINGPVFAVFLLVRSCLAVLNSIPKKECGKKQPV